MAPNSGLEHVTFFFLHVGDAMGRDGIAAASKLTLLFHWRPSIKWQWLLLGLQIRLLLAKLVDKRSLNK